MLPQLPEVMHIEYRYHIDVAWYFPCGQTLL